MVHKTRARGRKKPSQRRPKQSRVTHAFQRQFGMTRGQARSRSRQLSNAQVEAVVRNDEIRQIRQRRKRQRGAKLPLSHRFRGQFVPVATTTERRFLL